MTTNDGSTEDLANKLNTPESAYGEERTRNLKLEQQVFGLQYALAGKTGSDRAVLNAAQVADVLERKPDPKNVAEAVEMAEDILKAYNAPVAFTYLAYESALDSPFVRPREVLDALVRLGFLWHEVGSGKRREERAREILGCQLSLHESQTAMTKYKEERRVITPSGNDVYLEKHLKLGGGPQNDQTTLSIYFGDNDAGELIIGIVGRHPTGANTQ